jgi:hypothetical protein
MGLDSDLMLRVCSVTSRETPGISAGLHAKNILVVSKEVDELTFLFGAEAGPNFDDLGWVLGVELHSLGILRDLEGIERGEHGWADRTVQCTKAQLL